MRLHRFYINQHISADQANGHQSLVIESSELVHQIHSVFRLISGDEVILFDGSGSDFVCRIVDFDKKSMTFVVESAVRSRYMPSRKVFLFASVVKKDTFEWIVEKATELGVTDIIPVLSERSEKKNLNEVRLRKIAIEASEQCGRGDVPWIGKIESLSDVLKKFQNNKNKLAHILVFHTESAMKAYEAIKDIDEGMTIALFIGPEGGWSDGEIDLFRQNNMDIVTLGDQVLRAETAVVASLATVLL